MKATISRNFQRFLRYIRVEFVMKPTYISLFRPNDIMHEMSMQRANGVDVRLCRTTLRHEPPLCRRCPYSIRLHYLSSMSVLATTRKICLGACTKGKKTLRHQGCTLYSAREDKSPPSSFDPPESTRVEVPSLPKVHVLQGCNGVHMEVRNDCPRWHVEPQRCVGRLRYREEISEGYWGRKQRHSRQGTHNSDNTVGCTAGSAPSPRPNSEQYQLTKRRSLSILSRGHSVTLRSCTHMML